MRDKLIACLLISIALVVAGLTGVLTKLSPWSHRSSHDQKKASKREPAQEALRVKTASPRIDTNYSILVTQPAEVQPYYSVDLFAETAGTVLRMEYEVGDEIDRGQTVAEIQPIGSQSVAVIESPIDGVVVSRSVDPGTFVPNAAVLPGARPILSIAKTDVVTVLMNVPDVFAPYVKTGMPARIRNPNATKNQWIETKLTRVSPVASPTDRTVGVQVDLYNQTRAKFDELISDSQLSGYEDFKSRQPPEFPTNFSDLQEARLTPGLIHEMQITITDLGQLPLLPSECIVNRSGKPFVFLIEENRLVQVPVYVQFNDGKYCYVKPMRNQTNLQSLSDWTGQEVVVLASQFDLQSGKSVIADNP
ncbi:MAG: hypothetical protein RLZZ396_2573 [Planctomycetota bacterium]|jgi:multidrug efflux pump subunit AcrA (membrane-fusion protein)